MDKDFIQFLFSKTFRSSFNQELHRHYVDQAFASSLLDFKFHYPDKSSSDLLGLITFGTGWLNNFLYRLGNTIYQQNSTEPLLAETHWLLKEVCSSEIYFSITIGEGLYIRHGEGMIIGSRCRIGKGFVIHQHCTIGHKIKLGNGPAIGDNIEMGLGSSILGEINIGNNVMIGAHTLVLNDVPKNVKVVGVPGKIIS